MSISKTHRLLWKGLRRRLALFLSLTLISGSLGVITPMAETLKQDQPVIQEIRELQESIRVQQVSPGTPEKDLNFPDTLEVSTATDSDGERATWSDSSHDGWEQVPVNWEFFFADNGEDHYNENVQGTYSFQADLTGSYPVAGHVDIPVISVTVRDMDGLKDGEVILELIDLGDTLTSADPSISLFSASDGRVDLAGGTHEKWIDRINVPGYARTLYNKLAEGSDNDGVDDFLIDNSAFLKSGSTAITIGGSTFNGFQIYQTSNISEDEYILAALRAAFDAFDRDHPEVFWLSGKTNVLRAQSGSRYTYYFTLKTHSGFNNTFDVRASEYQSESRIKNDIQKREQQIDAILGTLTGSDVANQIVQLNEWLTTHNGYNTTSGSYPWESRECITALVGNSGTSGPVCEGYARAFKVLCDRLGIPCVLVDGQAGGGPHMWNYAQVEGKWYAVDTTWNDPGKSPEPLSGKETTNWLLIGSDTVVDGSRFIASHPVSNTASLGGIAFTNGPVLNKDKYPLKSIPTVSFSSSSQTVTYTGQPAAVTAPKITIKKSDGTFIEPPAPYYSYQRTGTSGYTSGLPTDAGTYTVRAYVPATDEYFAASGYMTLTIRKSAPTLSVSGSYALSKTYDGRPFAQPSQAQVAVTGASYGNVKFTWYRDSVSAGSRLNAAPSDAGTYILVASIDETDNTQAVSIDMGLTISRRQVTVEADPAGKDYGEADPEFTWHLADGTSLIGGDSLKGILSREPGEDTGEYAISPGTLNSDSTPNSEITFRPAVFTIRKAARIQPPQAVRVTDHQIELKPVNLGTGGGTVEYGYAGSDNLALVSWQGSSPRFSGLTPGTTYYFFVRVTGSTNYADSWRSASITTQKTILTVPVAGQSYVYTGNQINVNMAGYDPELMTMTGDVSGINAGDYTVQFQLRNTAHYAWKDLPDNTALAVASWRIEKADQAPLVLEDVGAKTYGDPSFELKATGGTGGGQIRFSVPEGTKVLSVSGSQAAILGAGTVRVTAVKAGNANYKDSAPAAADITVSKKPVTVTAADKRKTVNKDNPELTLVTPGEGVLVGDDTIDDLGVTLSTNAVKNSPAGTYQITGTASSDTNYQVTVKPGVLTVTRSGGSSGGGGGSSSGGGSGSGGGTSKGTSSPVSSSTDGSWTSDTLGWHFLTSDGSYASGRVGTDSQGNIQEYISWRLINNVWWAFGADAYAKQGWILDAASGLWYNVDINSGMRTNWYLDGGDGNWYFLDPSSGHMLVGWQLVNGVWYYLNPVSQAGRPYGAMYCNERTPDGYLVNADGSWTGR